jgi:hypothetical protein
VGVVLDQLRALAAENVLDRELVQPQSAGEIVELLLGRVAEVDPFRRVRELEAFCHPGERKALLDERSFAVHPGVHVAHHLPA